MALCRFKERTCEVGCGYQQTSYEGQRLSQRVGRSVAETWVQTRVHWCALFSPWPWHLLVLQSSAASAHVKEAGESDTLCDDMLPSLYAVRCSRCRLKQMRAIFVVAQCAVCSSFFAARR